MKHLTALLLLLRGALDPEFCYAARSGWIHAGSWHVGSGRIRIQTGS